MNKKSNFFLSQFSKLKAIPCPWKDEHGVALYTAIMLALTLGIMVGSLALWARYRSQQLIKQIELIQANYLAEGGINFAREELTGVPSAAPPIPPQDYDGGGIGIINNVILMEAGIYYGQFNVTKTDTLNTSRLISSSQMLTTSGSPSGISQQITDLWWSTS